MKSQMETIQAIKLIGIALPHKTTNENGQSMADCGNLWQQFEQGGYFDRIPGKSGDEVYAVYFDYDGDHTQPFSYFIGCSVNADTDVPLGMSSLTIPEGGYLKITAQGKMPDCVADAWRAIWKGDIDRAFQYDFERYDERSKAWNSAEVDIFLSKKQ